MQNIVSIEIVKKIIMQNIASIEIVKIPLCMRNISAHK